MATVTFEHVNKQYGDFLAVNDLNLEIGDGEFMVLVGPSGCGKTTSLRMIAGLEEITSGTLRIGDRVVNDVPPKDRDIAMVFQSYALYPHMSVRENLAFGLKLRKVPKPEIERRVNEAAETIQLQKLLDRKPKELSGGQRQRVALGRAIVREPAVFLMDEPLSNLDAKLRVQTRAEIARLHQRLETTMVYVTHDQVEAMTMGTRIAVMNEGLLQQVGTPQKLYDEPINRFVAGFIGSPSMNFVEVTVDGKDDTARLVGPGDWAVATPTRLRGIAGDIAGKKLVAGFRPEHLEIGDAGSDSASFQARADVVEYLGHEELLHVNAANQDIVAIVDSEHRVRPGDIIKLTLPLSKLHLFDDETGEALTTDPAAANVSAARPPSKRRLRHRPDRLTATEATGSAPEESGADLVERVVDSRVLHRGRYLTFRIDTIERPDGTRATRDVAGHPGAVAIIAVDPDGSRPAGTPVPEPGRARPARDPGRHARRRPDGSVEDPDLAARRELEEETGYPGRDVAAARPVLDRARVHDRADAPVPRDRAFAGRRRSARAGRGRATAPRADAVAGCRGGRGTR